MARPLAAESSAAAPAAMRPLLNLSYGEAKRSGVGGTVDPQRALDLYLPAQPATQPAASKPAPPLFLYIHGGAWVSGDKSQYAPLGLALSAQGVAVAIMNYRLSGDGPDGVRHPAHAQDAAAAVAYLRKHAAEYGYDPNRIFVGGHSAGAHMAALLAYDSGLLAAVGQRPESLRGFIGLEGIYDLNQLVRRFPGYRVDFLQLAFGSDETAWRAASPQNLIGSGVQHRPWLIVHSREDELVDLEQSQKFQKALEGQGIPMRWLLLDHGSHFSIIGELLNSQSRLSQQLLDFLRS